MKYHSLLIVVVIATLNSCTTVNRIVSPSGSNSVSMFLTDEGTPCLELAAESHPLISLSLGLESPDANLRDGFRITKVHRTSFDEEWTQPWGENKTIRDNHNEMAIELRNDDNVGMTVRVRAFDDGVAFRYEYNTDMDSLTVSDEITQFRFVQDGLSWSIPGSFETYELDVVRKNISEVERANTPFTFKMGDIYGSIHEAALYDFPEMNLCRCDSLVFTAELAPRPDGCKARVAGVFVTPWRTIQTASSAVGLINSSIILNLNDPCRIEDTSWIRPQKYVGVWWGMHLGTHGWICDERHGATTENAIRHIDFAAENGIDGVLFEGWNRGWESWGGRQHFDYCNAYPDFDLERIAQYAAERGVSLWMHNETGGSIFEYEAALDSAFRKYEDLGIHTVKTGYAGGMPGSILHHSQRAVQHYQKVVEKAACHKLMINAHEPIKETGIRRTWPNMMTREGAKGMEWNAWSRGNDSEYLCTIPFTRLLSGPMDYTPGVFDIYFDTAKGYEDRKAWNGDHSQCFIKTTLPRQIANWVLLYSPLQMACDLIENYEGHPAFQFFRDFDPDCDWSKALQGEIGEYIVIARRAGDRFFLGAGTDSIPRQLSVPLDFLHEGVSYKAVVYSDDLDAPMVTQPDGTDAPDKAAYLIRKEILSSDDTLILSLASDGGAAVSFIPIK